LVMAFRHMTFQRSKSDPCLFFKWTVHGLVLWVTWVDDCLVCGKKEAVLEAKQQLMARFDCDEVGELKEYIGFAAVSVEPLISISSSLLALSRLGLRLCTNLSPLVFISLC